MKTLRLVLPVLFTLFLLPFSAQAAGDGHALDGASLSIVWVIPFVCMLLSIAICPLVVPHFWHHHFGKVAAFWGLAFLIPCALVYGFPLEIGRAHV